MDKIRVLHVVKTLQLGGAEKNLFNLAAALDRSRFEVHVAYSFGGELEELFASGGVRLFKFSGREHKIMSLATPALVWRLARYLVKHRIDIVHTHTFNAHVWGLLAAKLTGRKLLEHVHDFRYMEAEEYRRRRGAAAQFGYAKFLKNTSDAVVVLTRGNVDFIARHRLHAPERVYEILNGIPPEQPPAKALTKTRFGIAEDARVILTAARIADEKNLDLVMRVAPAVIERCPRACFLIAGTGPLYEKFREESRKSVYRDAVKFVGFYENMTGLLELSDVFLLPSFLELHSIALLEAMDAGVPVVVSSGVGCHDEFLIDGENGFLLDPFALAGWAEVLIRLLEDDALCARIGQEGQALCRKKFDIRRTAAEMEKVYEKLVV